MDANSRRFVTRQDAIQQVINPALGEYVLWHDVNGIFEDAFKYINGAFECVVDTEEFWNIVERNSL